MGVIRKVGKLIYLYYSQYTHRMLCQIGWAKEGNKKRGLVSGGIKSTTKTFEL